MAFTSPYSLCSVSDSLRPTYSEQPLDAVERAFERLLLDGELAGVPATHDDLRGARVPAGAGEVFLRLARRFRAIRLVVADVTISLHEGELADDELGLWRLAAEPAEFDVRLGDPQAPDRVIDATWSPHAGDELVVHSTFLHFIVRAAVGDKL